jgi:hypothetical protein
VCVILAAISVPAMFAPRTALLVFAYAHNGIALVVWVAWGRNVRMVHRCILSGLVAIAGVAVGFAAPASTRATAMFAFAQAVHYVVWLRLMPNAQSRARAATTFRADVASLRRDFGAGGVAAIAIVAVTVPALACLHGAALVSEVYLSLAVFHGWLELAVIGHLVVTGDRLGEAA